MFNLFNRNKISPKDFSNPNLSNVELGRLGEKFAVKFLKKKGYKIIETNYKYHNYEVDIIAEHENYIVFVEVKTRRKLCYGIPSEAVDKQKQRKYKIMANIYLTHKKMLDRFTRFDVVEIYDGKPNLIVNAFD